jgi:polyribonucleotide nucleotidyltransferase
MSRDSGLVRPERGQILDGEVVSILDFGAFVDFGGPKDGLVHISEVRQGRVDDIRRELKVGDKVRVKVLDFDDRGKVRLSIKAALDSAQGNEDEDHFDE